MSSIRETKRLPLAKGCEMRFLVDESQPADSIHHHWAQTSYDGEPDSWVPVIGSHWHKYHDEYMEMLEGEIDFVLEGQTVTLRVGDPPLRIPKTKVHSFSFKKGVKTCFTEKTDPAGDFKENFFSCFFDPLVTQGGQPGLLGVMLSFYDGDCFLSLPGGFKALDENVTWLLSVVGKWWCPNGPRVQGSAVPRDAL